MELPASFGEWYVDRYRVYHKDIDQDGELRLTALLQMLQETAWNHAHVIGIGYHHPGFENLVWVLSRLRLELVAPGPRWMEDLSLATSPTGVDKLFALRDFVALRPDGVPFARATSAWIMIDAETRRPIRPQGLLTNGNFHFRPGVLPEGTVKLREPEGGVPAFERTTGWNDIDAHRHVNNVRYAEWCLDSYVETDWLAGRITAYDVNFNAETLWGRRMVGYKACSAPAPGDDLREDTFSIRDLDGGASAAVVRFGWTPRP